MKNEIEQRIQDTEVYLKHSAMNLNREQANANMILYNQLSIMRVLNEIEKATRPNFKHQKK